LGRDVIGIPKILLSRAAEDSDGVQQDWLVDGAGVRWERAHSDTKRQRALELVRDPTAWRRSDTEPGALLLFESVD
jgi:hypothetical protein